MKLVETKKLLVGALGVALAFSANASAATQSTAEDDTSWTDNLRLSYYGELEGPALGAVTSRQPTPRGEQGSPVDLYNAIKLGYNLPGGFQVYGQGRFQINFEGNGIDGINPRIGISKGDLIKIGDFSVYANLTNQFSTFSGAYWLAPGSFQVTSYPLGRFTVGTYTSERAYFYRGPGTGVDLAVYLGPYVNYKISPTLSATLVYDMAAVHLRGEGLDFDDDGTSLNPGLSWDLSSKINISPYLKIYTGDIVSLESTQLMVAISGSIL